MFLNFLLWQNRVPGVKTIVWAHNVHIAKYNLDSDEKPFGTWVRAMLGNQSFALGISARSGSYRNGGPDGDLVYLPLPPEDAIEGLISCRGIQKLDAGSFLPSQCLKATHSHSSRLLGRSFEHRDWYQLYDGVVVLETQHPPTLHSQ
jgi:erythromycin esterase-like protein